MKLTTVIARIIAVFGTSALSALAGGAILGVDLAKAAGMAGFMATAGVVERVLRAYYEDGTLTKEELDTALGGKK
jgi:hypothetical protein